MTKFLKYGIMWIVYSVLSSIVVIITEAIYRSGHFETFLKSLPYLIVPIILGQYLLYHLFRDAPNYLLAWAVFTAGTVILRFIANHYVGEPITSLSLLGIAMIISGAYVMKL